MHRTMLSLGFLFGLLGVAAGAFGAHALRETLGPDRLATFETAVRYQIYHALALLGVGLAAARWPRGGWGAAGFLFTAGILVFSGSLYALSVTGVRWLGALTPIGGVCLLAGWVWALFTT
ncbi:MAG: DUF423 domain-containing protein, partial [Gemmatimonadota bacterium]